MGWLTAFARCFTAALPQDERGDYLECVRKRIETHLGETDGQWTADVVGLRFKARLTSFRP